MAEPSTDHRSTLQYIVEMLDQLRVMSPPQAGSLLPHLIDVAKLEASEAMQKLYSSSDT